MVDEDFENSLAAFRRGFRQRPRAVVNRSRYESDAPARWAMANILDMLGRTEEAIITLNSIHDGYDWIDMYWLGPIYYQRGQWEEKLGKQNAALDTYQRFLDLMQDADAQFDDRKKFVEDRIDALLIDAAREGGSS